jgi:hypothetical protein
MKDGSGKSAMLTARIFSATRHFNGAIGQPGKLSSEALNLDFPLILPIKSTAALCAASYDFCAPFAPVLILFAVEMRLFLWPAPKPRKIADRRIGSSDEHADP